MWVRFLVLVLLVLVFALVGFSVFGHVAGALLGFVPCIGFLGKTEHGHDRMLLTWTVGLMILGTVSLGMPGAMFADIVSKWIGVDPMKVGERGWGLCLLISWTWPLLLVPVYHSSFQFFSQLQGWRLNGIVALLMFAVGIAYSSLIFWPFRRAMAE